MTMTHHDYMAPRALTTRSLTLVLITLTLGLSLSACGLTAHNLASVEQQVQASKARIRSLNEAKASAASYHTLLKSKQGKALLLSRADLESAARQMLPYVFKGKELHSKYLRGEISITKVSGFKLSPGNRGEIYLHFNGSKIKTRNVPAIARGQVKSLKSAIRSGKVLVEVRASVNNDKRTLVLSPRAIRVKFNKQNTRSNQNNFLDAVNRKLFNRAKRIPLPAKLKGPVSALSTPNYLALITRD